ADALHVPRARLGGHPRRQDRTGGPLMRLPWLAVFPVVWGIAFLALAAAFSGTASQGVYFRTEIEMVKILALLGSWGAAFAFEKGEYLRRAWLLIGASFACFLLRDLTLAPFGFEAL